MDPLRRVLDEVHARRKNLTWLAERMGCARQRVYNWKQRGVLPEAAYFEVATALGKTPNWLLGLDESGVDMSPMARQIVRAFEKIEDTNARMSVFVKIIELCAVEADAHAAPPAAQPARPPRRAPSHDR